MNKTGKGGTTKILIATALIVAIVVGILVGYNQLTNTSFGNDDKVENTNPTQCADSTATVTFNGFSALAKSTVASATYYVSQNGGVASAITGNSSSFPVGAKLTVLADASNYISDKIDDITVICGGQRVDVPLYATDTKTIRIFNSDGTAVLSDSATGGTQNQSNLANGDSLVLEVEIQGTDKQSSGDLVFVVEAGVAANISSITLNGDGVSSTVVPTFYADTLTGPKKAAFTIPAIVGAQKKTYTLGFQLATGKDLTGAVYTTVYSQQYFLDVDGTIKKGIENSEGTTKYEDTYDYDFFVASA